MTESAGSDPANALVVALPAALYATIFTVVAIADHKEKQGKKGPIGRFIDRMVMLVDKTSTLVGGIETLVGNWLPLSHFFQRSL
ncbi:hypothetical protein [Nocardiopsis sp. HUAS JQ3]|uniref:hypothetical protein n=1 Tax=Nocardiopsis sp. HUAS JQ3 TaxID=3061629 RepID=UPI0023A92E30|nr:hypothetical protein [Nocardiopsis sp. HUAS JQ3]WDZ90359.1 hypothetical protein PV789_26270 [Nocardiopsis sp. HUAS JQ3]